MLVLSRRRGEEIIIADNIRVVVIYSSDGTAVIGIEAPREIPIVRSEIANRPKKEAAGAE